MTVVNWLLIKLPVAVALFLAGVVLCCTVVFIPIGTALVDSAVEVLL